VVSTRKYINRRLEFSGGIELMNKHKEQIKDYVDDHYRYFAFYPYDVEVEDKIYSYQEYMKILGYSLLDQIKK
jgi:hypothetical protein